jgi:hypothetical protein
MVVPTVTVITASGSYTKPVGCKYIKAFAIGGGGGGGSGSGLRGSGGGSGQVVFGFFDESSAFTVTIGSGGSSNNSGTSTVFQNFTSGNSISASGGSSGTDGAAAIQRGGNTPITFPTRRLFAQSGFPSSEFASGNGGSCMFGSGGRGVRAGTDTSGGTGLGFGAGGGGGRGVVANGGSGADGGVIIFEYY